MNYKLVKDAEGNVLNMVRATTDEGIVKFIPNDLQNRDWVEYQAWLAAGNEPDPAD